MKKTNRALTWALAATVIAGIGLVGCKSLSNSNFSKEPVQLVQTLQKENLQVSDEQHKKDRYSKLVESYKSLNLDNLVAEDFEKGKPIEISNEDKYLVLDIFIAYKENLNVAYFKINLFEKGKIDADESFRILNISNAYSNSDPETFKGIPIKFDSYYNINGEPHAIGIFIDKPNKSKKPDVDKWVLKDKITFKKHLDKFYASYTIGEEFVEDEPVLDSESIKHIEDLFSIAAKNYKIVEGLVEE